ncbi:MAG: hypothetical protein VYD26_04430 [Actinomycetota bacterium]|nr:hypothetical protein [Actinomycetota bacterium]
MAEDIFSQFYNLFNNDDEVNWNLAEQVSKHILKDEEETYALEHEGGKINIEAIFRAVQINIEGQVETEIVNIEIDTKEAWALWFINSCKHFDFSILDISSPDLPININNMKSSIIGMQLGNLAGGLAKHSWGISPTGIILPKSKTIGINIENLLRRVNNLDIDSQEALFAALALEYTTLTLGKFSSPLLHLIDVLNKATEELIAEIEKLNTEVDIETNDLNEIMQNFTENNNAKFENIFDDMFAPLSFYRECIVALAKEYVNIDDYSLFDVLVDSSIGEYEENIFTQLNSKINQFSEHSRKFIEYLHETKNPNSLIDILNDKTLIPSEDELIDPIIWAARTSLPPI